MKEGTAVALVQSGLPEEWCDCAMECGCYLRNVHDKIADGKTAFEKRYVQKFDGPSIPCETLVEYIPVTAKDKSRVHQFGQKTLRGTLLGCVPRAGGGWSGDLMVADYEDLQESEAPEIHVKRSNSQEVIVNGDRPRPSSIAERNHEPEDDVEIEEGDKKERETEYSWSMSGDFYLSTPS